MVEVNTIFDGVTATDEILESSVFVNADFLFFETPNLASNEGYELAVSLSVNIVEELDINTVDFGNREIPIEFPNNVADTQVLIPVPREITQTKLNCKILLITTQEIRLIIHAVSSQVLNSELLEQLENNNNNSQNQGEQIIDTIIDIIKVSGGDVSALLPLIENVVTILDSLSGIEIPALPPSVDTISELEAFY